MFEEILAKRALECWWDYDYSDWCEEIATKTPMKNLIELHEQIGKVIQVKADEIAKQIAEIQYDGRHFSFDGEDNGTFSYCAWWRSEREENFQFDSSALYDDGAYVEKIRKEQDEKVALKKQAELIDKTRELNWNKSEYLRLQKELGLSDDS